MIKEDFIEEKIGEILKEGMGLDWKNDPNLKETPKRVAKVYKKIYEGYEVNPQKFIKKFPSPKKDMANQMIVIKDIICYSVCSHHMLPFKVNINIGYIPNNEILGISKFERISKNICHKLQLQENITEEIADFLNKELKPKEVIVTIKDSEHLCMLMRGVETKQANITTSAIRGVFEQQEIKNEFLNLIS